MTKPITKNQHIVPQVHLRKFLSPGSSKLECFNAEAVRLEKPQSPRSICSSHFYYALEAGIEDEFSQIVETSFGNLETWYGDNNVRIEEQLLSENKISNDDRYAIAWIIANFYFRGYSFRSEVKESLKSLTDWMKGFVKEDWEHHIENTSYATNRAFDKGFANTLTHKHWRVFINNSLVIPFITGDEAIIDVVPQWANDPRVLKAYLIRTQLFHLSPRIAIEVTYPVDDSMKGQTVFEDITDNIKEIKRLNLLYVNHTHKYVYSSSRYFFEELIKFETRKKNLLVS